MVTLTRKQREIEQREQLILEVARDMLLSEGYLGMTMDRIATACEYSKGTIYNHFPNKEEVVAALTLQLMNLRTDLFARASTFSGNTRERMMAIGVALDLFVQLYPLEFKALTVIQAISIRAKTSEKMRQALQACDNRCMNIVIGIVRDAIAQGDLELDDDTTPELLTFGLWSLNFGAHSLMRSDIPLEELGIKDAFEATQRSGQKLLDGYKWLPLSDQWDYRATEKRICEEIFQHEFQRIQNR